MAENVEIIVTPSTRDIHLDIIPEIREVRVEVGYVYMDYTDLTLDGGLIT
jgi:hypothetical protein